MPALLIRCLFLHEKMGLKIPNFLTFPDSLLTFKNQKKNHSVSG